MPQKEEREKNRIRIKKGSLTKNERTKGSSRLVTMISIKQKNFVPSYCNLLN